MRSGLNLKTENQYLHVHFNLPPLAKWEPREVVKNWIINKQRRHRDLFIEGDSKAKGQLHFKGVFAEAVHQIELEEKMIRNK